MATQAQIDANRRNALKSTGPKTPEGKARASRNATTFGLYSREVILPGEDAEQLKAIRDDAFGRLDPIGQLETLYAERFVSASWRLRRALAGEAKLLTHWRKGNGFRDASEIYTDPVATKALDKLQRHIASLERAMDRSLAELRRLQKTRSERQNDEIEANPESETSLAGSLATREESNLAVEEQTANSNPIATMEEATNEQEESENSEFEASRTPDDEGATADPSPGIAIPGFCAADSSCSPELTQVDRRKTKPRCEQRLNALPQNPMLAPPSIGSTIPVTNLAAGEQR